MDIDVTYKEAVILTIPDAPMLHKANHQYSQFKLRLAEDNGINVDDIIGVIRLNGTIERTVYGNIAVN